MSNLLPPNATPAEISLEATIARISSVPVPVRDVWNVDTIASDLLPWLAWAVSVDEWSAEWSEDQKRLAIRSSASIHKYKGTIGAVREAVAALGLECVLQEWFAQDPPGAPYTFDLIIDAQNGGATQRQLFKLVDVVNAAKNLRSHLDQVVVGATSEAESFSAGVSLTGFELTVNFESNLFYDGSFTHNGAMRYNGFRI